MQFTIPYDMIHIIIMYAQELIRAKGLKEWQTLLSSLLLWYIIINFTYNSADIQACYLAKKANI